MDARQRIEQALEAAGITATGWRDDAEDGLTADLGRARVTEENEDAGQFEGDEGELTALVVGAAKFGNERVAFYFKGDGMTDGDEIEPFDVELI